MKKFAIKSDGKTLDNMNELERKDCSSSESDPIEFPFQHICLADELVRLLTFLLEQLTVEYGETNSFFVIRLNSVKSRVN